MSRVTTAQGLQRVTAARTAGLPLHGIAPYRGSHVPRPWEGVSAHKPWDYRVTATVPALDTPEPLAVCLDVLRAQTERPYLLVIDTGSQQHAGEIESLRAEDCEVHLLRSHGWRHPSQPVAVACDLALTLCQTEFLFYTHADCFLRSPTLLADWLELAREHTVVGYQISPRPYEGWEAEVGHTALMIHVPTIRRLGINWCMHSYANAKGGELTNECFGRNDPDTESNFNRGLREAGVVPLMLGGEANHERNVNEHFDHVRSWASAQLYSPAHAAKMEREMQHAMREARIRAADWRRQSCVP